MRSKNKLLDIVIARLMHHNNYICNAIDWARREKEITLEEHNFLLDLIWENKPTKNRLGQIYAHELYKKETIERGGWDTWWFAPNPEILEVAHDQRIKFVNALKD